MGSSVSETWKDDGYDVIAVIRGVHRDGWNQTLTLLDPEEGNVTNPGDRTLISRFILKDRHTYRWGHAVFQVATVSNIR